MKATVIDGKAVAAKVRGEIRIEAERLKERGIVPCLAVILVGEDPASVSYVRAKQKALIDTGMEGRDIRLSPETAEAELLSLITALNADDDVHGILVQLPLPEHIRQEIVITAIDPRKDVDCFHPVSLGKLLRGHPGFLPCTPHGVLVLLKEHKIPVKGRHAVVIGRSNIVGKPLSALLAQRQYNATVTLCHSGTADLSLFTRQADILVVAVGSPRLVTGDMIKKGAAVIDVGVNVLPQDHVEKMTVTPRKLCGDVVFNEALDVAGWITPVPGGVGPMTVAMLMRNVLLAAGGK